MHVYFKKLTMYARSLKFQEFVAKCLVKDVRSRSTARQLLSHKFFEDIRNGKQAMVEVIEEVHAVVKKRGYGLYDGDDIDVSLRFGFRAENSNPLFLTDGGSTRARACRGCSGTRRLSWTKSKKYIKFIGFFFF